MVRLARALALLVIAVVSSVGLIDVASGATASPGYVYDEHALPTPEQAGTFGEADQATEPRTATSSPAAAYGYDASADVARPPTRLDGYRWAPQTPRVPSPLENIPENAQVRVLKPDPNGGAQYGVEYKWVNEQGKTVRFRAHGPDGTAPPGSNAATGETYRVQVGSRYLDADGTLYPQGVHNPKSPNYDRW